MNAKDALEQVRTAADRFAADRHDRQRRRELDTVDFEQLSAAGFLLTGVSTELGGIFESAAVDACGSGDTARARSR